MRVANWEQQLQLQINNIVAYDKFIRGKNDCGTFVINFIEVKQRKGKNAIIQEFINVKEILF